MLRQNWKAKVYHQKIKDTPPPEWEEIRQARMKKDDYCCYRCEKRDKRGRGLTVHHLIPRSEGGPNDLTNLITLCYQCHDFVEVEGYRTLAEIAGSIDLGIEKLPEKGEAPREETFERPAWHKYVYGGARHLD